MWSLAAVLLALAIGLGFATGGPWVGGLCMGSVGCLVAAWTAAQARSERIFLPASLIGLILLGVGSWLAHQAPASGFQYAPLAVPALLAAFWLGASVFFRLCAVALSEDEHPDLAIYAPQGYPGCLSSLCMLVALWQLGILAQKLLG